MSPLLIAHRGDSARAPENTVAAFEQAIAKGAGMIEMDLLLSVDGEVVISHDDTLWRRARKRRRLDRMTADELAHIDVSRGFPASSPEGIPRLAEVLAGAGKHVPLYLELKSAGGGRKHRGNRFLLEACLRQIPRNSRHLLASFDAGLVRGALQAGRKGVLILKDPAALKLLAPAERRQLHAVSARFDLLTAPFVDTVRRTGARLWCWTIDGEKKITQALDRGADGVCCNDVGAARAVIDRYLQSAARKTK